MGPLHWMKYHIKEPIKENGQEETLLTGRFTYLMFSVIHVISLNWHVWIYFQFDGKLNYSFQGC